MVGSLVGWLFVWLVDWLAVDWLVGWLVGCLAGMLADCLPDLLVVIPDTFVDCFRSSIYSPCSLKKICLPLQTWKTTTLHLTIPVIRAYAFHLFERTLLGNSAHCAHLPENPSTSEHWPPSRPD